MYMEREREKNRLTNVFTDDIHMERERLTNVSLLGETFCLIGVQS